MADRRCCIVQGKVCELFSANDGTTARFGLGIVAIYRGKPRCSGGFVFSVRQHLSNTRRSCRCGSISDFCEEILSCSASGSRRIDRHAHKIIFAKGDSREENPISSEGSPAHLFSTIMVTVGPFEFIFLHPGHAMACTHRTVL